MSHFSTKAVYDYICLYIEAHRGYPPSIREIARGAYLAPSTVIRHLDRLEAWGLIEREPNLPRSIRLTEKKWTDN